MALTVQPLGNYLYWNGGLGNSGGQDPGDAFSFSSMTAHPNGTVYTSEDTPNRGQHWAGKTLVWMNTLADAGVNQPQDPLDITCNYFDGNLYFADHGGTKVNVWSPAGVFVRKWGTHSATPVGGQIAELEAVLCDGVGNVYVSDIGVGFERVIVYDYLGTYNRVIPGATFFFPKCSAVTFDGTKYINADANVYDSTSGALLTTLVDENGSSLVGPLNTVFISPGSAANNIWCFSNTGKIWRYNPSTLNLIAVYQIDMANQVSPLGQKLIIPNAPIWSVNVEETLIYLNNWDSPYLYSFSLSGNRGGPLATPRGRGAGW